MIKVLYPFVESYVDYPSPKDSCVSVFIIGCSHNCPNCHNKELQDFDYNKDGVETISYKNLGDRIIKFADEVDTNKVTLLGGDPLHPKNINDVRLLLRYLYLKDFDVCVYTGYSIDYIRANPIKNFKYLKTGLYKEEESQKAEKTDNYFTLASKNQIIWDSNFKKLSKKGKLNFKREVCICTKVLIRLKSFLQSLLLQRH